MNMPFVDTEYQKGKMISKGVRSGTLKSYDEENYEKVIMQYDELINKGEKEMISKEEYDFLVEANKDIKNMEKEIIKSADGSRKSVYVRNDAPVVKNKEINGFFGNMSLHPDDVKILKGLGVGNSINFTDSNGQRFYIQKSSDNVLDIINLKGHKETIGIEQIDF